jgi:hypothetical protein
MPDRLRRFSYGKYESAGQAGETFTISRNARRIAEQCKAVL